MTLRDSTRGAARLVMLLAAFLAAGASFGLHPEPAGPERADGPALECAHSPGGGASAHDCVACRAHRSTTLSKSSDLLSTPIAAAPRRGVSRSVFPRPGAPSRCDGRAPPEP